VVIVFAFLDLEKTISFSDSLLGIISYLKESEINIVRVGSGSWVIPSRQSGPGKALLD
jgi:hypothetical protein